MSLIPVFTLNLGIKILPGKVTIGCYDSKYPCLTAATVADKIFIHNPHNRLESAVNRMTPSGVNQEINLLNINQTITSICAGRLKPDKDEDVLLVGTTTNLLAYDVKNNSDLFFADVPDGVNCVTLGYLGSYADPLAVVGGNCSLQGFDYRGEDPFWTVTGDNVTSLSFVDFDNDGKLELLVGSEDYDIRVFKDDEILSEITETETVTGLAPLKGGRFGYSLMNGTVGVYDRNTRYWRIKSKNQPVAIIGFDIDGDGVDELIIGWNNGKIEARNDKTGEVVFKDTLSHPVAGIVKADYRLDGKLELICCSVEGEVKGYSPSVNDGKKSIVDTDVEQETIRELTMRKQNLLLEISNYEQNERIANQDADALYNDKSLGVIASDTQLQTGLALELGLENKTPGVVLNLSTNNETILRCVLIFAEGIFPGECLVIHSRESQLSKSLSIPLNPPKDVLVDLHIKAMVGYKGSTHYHVFELSRQLPKFSMYALQMEGVPSVESYVSFRVNERVQRLVVWVNQNFLLSDELVVEPGNDLLLSFLSLRDKRPLVIQMSNSSDVVIQTDDMDLAGDIVQDLADYLKITELQVEAHFPEAMSELMMNFQKAVDLQSVQQRLVAEIGDNSGMIRSLVVRAEDTRLLRDFKNMKKWYLALNDLNKDLINSYKIRLNSHQDLTECLKSISKCIHRAARLRVGKSKQIVIAECREAMKHNNTSSLLKIIKSGIP